MQFKLRSQTQLQINDGRIHVSTIGDNVVRLRAYYQHYLTRYRNIGNASSCIN